MKVIDNIINGVKIVVPDVHFDDRGYFFESFNDNEFRTKVCDTIFVQDNQSKSSIGTLRGLHWQRPPYAQSKLVRVTHGKAFDVAVDIRIGSPTFGEWTGIILDAENNYQFFIPRGFAHGFLALTDDVIFQYKCDNLYNKESEAAIAWDSVGINWPKPGEIEKYILSDKDKNHPTLETIDKSLLFNYDDNLYF